MFAKKKPEVLIAGAGPVGLFAAVALARRGIPLRIVDEERCCGARSDALALHAESLRLLADVGILDRVLPKALRVDTIGLYEGDARRAEIRLAEPGDESSRVAVVPQNVLEHALEDALHRLGVNVSWNHAVSQLAPHDRGAAVTVDRLAKESMGYAVEHTEWVVGRSQHFEVPFVIGADGHRSAIRRALRIDFPVAQPAQHFAMFEFKTNVDLGHELRIMMDGDTTNAVWPLPDGCCRWILELQDVSAPASALTKDRLGIDLRGDHDVVLSDDNLRALLSLRAPWFHGTIEEITWRIIVRFQPRLATAFGKDRTWLVGDAGHVTGPVGMQSMNIGLREANDLAEIIAGILHGGDSFEALEQYNRERIAEWQQLLGIADRLETAEDSDVRLADRGHRLIACLPASGERLESLVDQLR